MWPMPQSCRKGILSAVLLVMLGSAQALGAALDDIRAGNEFFKAGRLDDAVSAYTQAITSGELESETLAITYNNRGVALGEQSEFERAIEDYEKALQLLPADATTLKNMRVAYVKRGVLRQSQGEHELAASDLNAAIEAQPDHYLAYLRRAELNVAIGNLALAVSDYKLALARKPGDADLIAALNHAREALSQPADKQLAIQESQAPEPAPAENAAAGPASDERTALDNTEPAASEEPVVEQTQSEPVIAPAVTPAPTAESSVEPAAGAILMRTLGAVNVRDAPANSGNLLTTVAEGVDLPVLGEELSWKRVQLSDGRIGYIYKRWMAPIESQ